LNRAEEEEPRFHSAGYEGLPAERQTNEREPSDGIKPSIFSGKGRCGGENGYEGKSRKNT
jgi:hypothetical protein